MTRAQPNNDRAYATELAPIFRSFLNARLGYGDFYSLLFPFLHFRAYCEKVEVKRNGWFR